MKFLRVVVLLIVLAVGKFSTAQIICNFDSINASSTRCAPYFLIDSASSISSFPIIERRWYLTGPINLTVVTGGLNPTFQAVLPDSGHYCLRLWAENSNGDTCSLTKCVDIAGRPGGSFSFTPKEGCAPLDVTGICNSTPGSGVIISLIIDWGCGALSTFTDCPSTPVTHTYTCAPMCYSPTIIVTNSYGCTTTDTAYRNLVCIIPPLVANFTADTTFANCASGPLTVHFTADSAVANVSYKWYINNVLIQNGFSRYFTHSFAIDNVNCYDMKLVVSHVGGCIDSITKSSYICVRSTPEICFTVDADSACLPHTLTLTNCTPGLANLDFTLTGPCGPYTPVTGSTATYNLTCDGTYTASATGTFAPGCTASIAKQVLMKASPLASYTVNDNFGCTTPTCVIYTATPCAGCTYGWTFSGGSPNFIAPRPISNANTCYNSFGTFPALLTVIGSNGCSSTDNRANIVNVRRINPVIRQNRVSGCSPLCATFTDGTNYALIPDPISSVCWSFPGSALPGSCTNPFTQCFNTPGCYNVQLKVTTTTGCIDSARINNAICVGIPPVCTFTVSPTTLCFEQEPVVFSSNCPDPGVCFFVNYGDGDSGIVCTPVFEHSYQDTGNIVTCITPISDSCAGTPVCITIHINSPIAKFTYSSTCNSGNSVCLNNGSAGANRYKWYFCNGDSSTLASPCVVLPPCDTCGIRLYAYNDFNGCVHTVRQTINTVCGIASISPTSADVCAARILATVGVPFTNTSSSQATPNQTMWDYDTLTPVHGTIFGPSGQSVTPFYNAPGRYVIAMRNVSASGCIDTVYANVKICKPLANFTNNSACFPNPICFNDISVDGFCTINSWKWKFGDGSAIDTTRNPCHVYGAPGTYTVKLIIRNDNGCVDSFSRTVIVSDFVALHYSVDTLMCPGVQHCVTNSSTGIALTYTWTIPNALPYDTFAVAPCYTINTPGDYWIHVNISSNNLCTTKDSVLVHACPPDASGYISQNFFACPDPNNPVQFISTSTCYDSIVSWSFGDQYSDNRDTATHFYGYPGSYPICLTVTSRDGCVDTKCIDTIVVQGPYGIFTVLDTPGICACKDTVHFLVSTVNSSSMILLYGCSQGFCQTNPIFPIGTAANPTVISCAWPYCLIDSCKPQLIFGDTAGCIVYDTKPAVYIDSPVVNFTFDSYGSCLTGTVCFYDSTIYHLRPRVSHTDSVRWYFGDGTTDTVSSPCHTYPGAGIWHPRYYVWSNLGCLDSVTAKVVIIPNAPNAGYFADDSFVCVNTPICFHDTSTSDTITGIQYEVWNFGDGATDTSYIPDVCHTYTSGGYYTVMLCVYDSLGCPNCFSSEIHVIDKPIADAGADTTVCYGRVVSLNGSGAVTCHWFPSSLVSDSAICNPTVQLYNDAQFTLIVTDQYQCKDTDEVSLTVARVTAGFNVGNTFCLQDSICVVDTSTNYNGTITSWTYDFGNGVSSSLQNGCFKYTSAGNYTITQIVADNNGCTDTATKQLVINLNPSALFSVSDPVICSNQTLCVTDMSSGATALSWNWNYGPGQTSSNLQNPPCYSFIPPYLNNYSILLTVTDQNNCSDTVSHSITLNEVPAANFVWSTSCVNVPMQLSNNSIAGDTTISSCEWTFWLGSPSPTIDNNCSTSFLFPIGFHDVQLIVTDLNGCIDTIVKTVQTDSSTYVSVNPRDTTVCLGTTLDYTVVGIFNNVCWTPHTWLSDSICSPSAANQTITPLGNVSYLVSAVNGACPPSLDTVTIHVIQPIPIEITATPDRIILGLSSRITSQIPGVIDSIIWTPDSTLDCRDCANPIATPHQTTTYTATIYYSQNGVSCTNMASVTITFLNSCDETPPYLPNTFTPNGDGTNDIFMIRGIAGKKINYFRIFNRWGELVFESTNGEFNDPRWGWDGTDRHGKKLNPGVFVYTYEIECANHDTKTGKGNVSLVR